MPAVEIHNDYQKVFEGLLQRIRRYDQTADIGLLRKAFEYSFNAHGDQLRISGKPYFEHPLEVVKILTGLKMDWETIAAGVLHDVVEDTKSSIEDIKREFGNNIAQLVDGVTKISELKLLGTEDQQAEKAAWAELLKALQQEKTALESATPAKDEPTAEPNAVKGK